MIERLRRQPWRRPQNDDEPQATAGVPLPETEEAQNANVQVISGASLQDMPLAGLQISQAREIAGRVLNLDPGAVALVNGQPVRANYRLQRGDTLEFVHHAGEKG